MSMKLFWCGLRCVAIVYPFYVVTASGDSCHDKTTCEELSSETVRASAMLQVNINTREKGGLAQATRLWKSNTFRAMALRKLKKEKSRYTDCNKGSTSIQAGRLQEAHLQDARACLANGLQEAHMQAMWRHASLLVTGVSLSRERSTCACENGAPCTCSGANSPLDAAGFKATTSLCCPTEMEQFFNRLLESNNMYVCSKPHVQGLMHWFTCVPDMDPQYILDVVKNGNPCKYWAPKGQACPEMSPQCLGTFCR